MACSLARLPTSRQEPIGARLRGDALAGESRVQSPKAVDHCVREHAQAFSECARDVGAQNAQHS
eukprot:4518600-Alexandrium_andersonii.AAC.1